MNTFYYNDKTEKIQKEKPDCIHVVIETNKTFQEFTQCFYNCRFEGYSIADCIDWAK